MFTIIHKLSFAPKIGGILIPVFYSVCVALSFCLRDLYEFVMLVTVTAAKFGNHIQL